MATSIHIADYTGKRCSLCGASFPLKEESDALPVRFNENEFIGVIIFPTSRTSYRIGENNQDPLCDGTPATQFSQKSLAKK